MSRLLLWALWVLGMVALTGWLVVSDVALSGNFSVAVDFEKEHADVSRLYPRGRLAEVVRATSGDEQPVLAEPLYFDVAIPRHLASGTIALSYGGDIESIAVGVRLPPTPTEPWRYAMAPLTDAGEFKGRRQGNVTLPLTNAFVEHQRIRFVISAPELTTGKTFVLYRIEATLSGEPLSIGGALRRIPAFIGNVIIRGYVTD